MNRSHDGSPKQTLFFSEVLVLALSVYVLGALLVQTFVKLPDAHLDLLRMIDGLVCLVFLFDFIWRFFHAENKWRFMRWGWIDLISSLPMLTVFRWGRVISLIRILRLLLAFNSARALLGFLFRRRARSLMASVALMSVVLIIASSIVLLTFETGPQSSIHTPGQALWCSFETLVGVGYGDLYPMSWPGRAAAGLLMVCGLALLGTFTGYLTSIFLQPVYGLDGAETQRLRLENDMLRAELERLRSESGGVTRDTGARE